MYFSSLRAKYEAFLAADKTENELLVRAGSHQASLVLLTSAEWEEARKALSDELLAVCPEIMLMIDALDGETQEV